MAGNPLQSRKFCSIRPVGIRLISAGEIKDTKIGQQIITQNRLRLLNQEELAGLMRKVEL